MTPPYLASIHHDGSPRYVSNPYPTLGETVRIKLRTAPDAPITHVLLRTEPDGEQHFAPLTPLAPDAACRWWQIDLAITMPIVKYRFLVMTDDGLWTYNASGLHDYTPTDYHDFRLIADYAAPRWVHSSVFYQIFPDRFADGDPDNNVRSGEWTVHDHATVARSWDEPPGHSNPSFEFYGGDLQGIAQRLPYLEELGVNALYLNPIFTAPSVHRYDVSDYSEVDPHLGGEAGLVELRAALTARSMRLMLDIVPNHCGVTHPSFQSALADRASPYSDRFIFTDHPREYASWLGVRSLPKLDFRSPSLRDEMYAGSGSIFRRWLKPPFSIDAWRVDVANMLGRRGATQLNAEIVRGIRAAVKQENAQAYLIGENFFDATDQLQGDQFDANMNYRGFTTPLWEWLHRRVLRHPTIGEEVIASAPASTTALAQAWTAFRAPIPRAIAAQQFNLLDSHDTARIRTIVGGNARLHGLAAALQLSYPGVPCIYYGDEIGLDAEDSTHARRTMPWNETEWDHDLRAFYQRLIQLRRTSSALATGGFQLLHTNADTVAYLRDSEDEQVVVVGYRGSDERAAGSIPVAHGALPNGTIMRDELSGAKSIVTHGVLPVPAMRQGAAIWRTVG